MIYVIKEIKSPPDVLVVFLTANEASSFPDQTSLAVKKTKRTSGGDLISIIA